MNYWSVPPIWAGDTAYLLAGGPSLRGFDARCLRGEHVIVINDSWRLAPWAEVLYACDASWWQRNEAAIEPWSFRYRVTLENEIEGVKRLRNTGAEGLETDPCGLRHGSNSGYQAIGLAYHLGASRIVLLGFDMHVAGNRTHWHELNGKTAHGMEVAIRSMLPKFASLVDPLRQAGVEVVNATPGSRLDCWPRVSLSALQTSAPRRSAT